MALVFPMTLGQSGHAGPPGYAGHPQEQYIINKLTFRGPGQGSRFLCWKQTELGPQTAVGFKPLHDIEVQAAAYQTIPFDGPEVELSQPELRNEQFWIRFPLGSKFLAIPFHVDGELCMYMRRRREDALTEDRTEERLSQFKSPVITKIERGDIDEDGNFVPDQIVWTPRQKTPWNPLRCLGLTN